MKRELAEASTDDSRAQEIVQEALSLERLSQLLGHEGFGQELMDLIMAVLRNALEASTDRCYADHRLDEILALLEMARTWQLLGFALDSDDIVDRALGCARFEVRVTAEAEHSDFWPLSSQHEWAENRDSRWNVQTTIPLTLDTVEYNLTGSGEIAHTEFEYRVIQTHRGGEDCPTWTRTATAHDAPATIPGTATARMLLDLNQYKPPRGGVPSVIANQRLTVSTGAADTTAREMLITRGTCGAPDGNPVVSGPFTRWRDTLNFVYQRAGRTMPDPFNRWNQTPVVFNTQNMGFEFAAIDQSGATVMEQQVEHRWSSSCSGLCADDRWARTHVRVVHTPVAR